MSQVRTLTRDEYNKGYYVLACGCHAHVFTNRLVPLIDVAMIEECNGITGVVRLSHMEEIVAKCRPPKPKEDK